MDETRIWARGSRDDGEGLPLIDEQGYECYAIDRGCVAASARSVANTQVQEEDGIRARSDSNEDAREGELGSKDRGPQCDGRYVVVRCLIKRVGLREIRVDQCDIVIGGKAKRAVVIIVICTSLTEQVAGIGDGERVVNYTHDATDNIEFPKWSLSD